jgi:hypothetical protein
MLYLEACIEKYYLRIVILLFILGWLYLYFINQRNIDKINDQVKDWYPF